MCLISSVSKERTTFILLTKKTHIEMPMRLVERPKRFCVTRDCALVLSGCPDLNKHTETVLVIELFG